MTEEQIVKNAEKRVAMENSLRKPYGKRLLLTSIEEELIKESYIAGAHSRNEEIKELKEQIETVSDEEISHEENMRASLLSYKLACESKEITIHSLQCEIKRLNNPWISVNHHLPERDGRTNTSVVVFVLTERGLATSAWYDFDDNEWHLLYGFVDVEGNDKMDYAVTHWMPIPKLQIEN